MDSLSALGWSTHEEAIYKLLVRLGPASASQLASRLQMNRRAVYDTVARLEERGAIGTQQDGRTQLFVAQRPEALFGDLANDIQKAGEKLQQQWQSMPPQSSVQLFSGRAALRGLLKRLLDSGEYLSIGSTGHFPHIMKHDFERFQQEKQERRVKSKILISQDMSKDPAIPKLSGEYRFLPSTDHPTSTFITDAFVVQVLWEEPIQAVLWESKPMAELWKQHFELLWEHATPN